MVYRFGTCLLDPQRHRLLRGGQPVRLRAKAFRLLCYLLEHRDRTVLKAELYEAIWPQAFISEATLESTVRAVRQAIGDTGRAQALIQTVYSHGYRFVAAVEERIDVPPGTPVEAVPSLPDTTLAPPLICNLHAALVPPVQDSAAGDDGRCATAIGDEGGLALQEVSAALTPGHSVLPFPIWEQKTVAVLAVDLTFPTTTDGAASVDEPWTVASRWEQAIVATIQRFGGVVLQHSPSLLLTAFGIPRTLEQLPQRAVQAALTLRHLTIEGSSREPCPELRLVVHWGPLLVDVQASDPIAQLRPIGETLAWPVRLLGQAAPGDILLSPEVGAMVEGWYELEVREVPFQGEQLGRNQVFAVVGNKAQWSRLEVHRRRPLSRFIGRDQELATLHHWLRQVKAGRGQVVAAIGEPGVGKSRLCYEFVRGALAPPWLILEAPGSAYDQATLYLPIIALLRSYFCLDDRVELPTVRDTVSAKLCSLDQALMPTVSAVLTLLNVPVEDPQWQALEASQRRRRTLDAVAHLLVRESQRQPLLLVAENLHWIDGETQALLDRLVESLPTARILLLVTYRPEYRHGWGQKTYYTQLRLDPLRRDSAHALLNSLLGDDVDLEPLKQRLNERTQGNPFFLEECIRSLVETRDLVGGPGAYSLAKAPLSLQMPSSVQATLAARIDRLPLEEKQLLQTAAVIGTEVPYPLLRSVAELSEAELHRCLAHLQGVEFLYERRLFPEIEYTFKHALTQEVAYGSLPQARRRALHARIVEGIERLYADHLIDRSDQLAHHALRGEVWEKAALYCRRVGAKAAARSAYREAVTLYEQALDAMRHLPESRDAREQAIDVRLTLRTALLPTGDLGRTLNVLREAETLALSLDDPGRLGQVLRFMSIHFRFLGAYGQAIIAARRALELATAGKDVVRQALAQRFLGDAYQAQGDYRRAIDCYRWTMASIETTRSGKRFGQVIPPAVRSRARLALCHAELGMFAEGRALGEEGLQIAEAADQPASLMFASAAVGRLWLSQGDLTRAIPLLERAASIAQEADLPLYGPAMAIALGAAYTLDGRLTDAARLLSQALAQAGAMEVVATQALGHLALGVVYLRAGDLEEAQVLAERVLTSACERQERSYEAYALHLLGEIAAHWHLPEVAQAEDYYHQATAMTRELGMRPLMAHCHRGLGTLYAKSGRRQQAHTELTTAIDLYRSMDMTFWLPQAEAMRAHIGGWEPSNGCA